jgi:hypothetical protein
VKSEDLAVAAGLASASLPPENPMAGCIAGEVIEDVIVPPPGDLFSETNDNSVAILLSHGTPRVLLAGDAVAREKDYSRAVRARGPKR